MAEYLHIVAERVKGSYGPKLIVRPGVFVDMDGDPVIEDESGIVELVEHRFWRWDAGKQEKYEIRTLQTKRPERVHDG